MSVRNHAKKHLSRQLLKSDDMKQVTHSKNLFEEVQELIDRTKAILTAAEDNNKSNISLGAIRELRCTYEFLIKFSVYIQQAQKEDKEAERARDLQDVSRLSVHEMRLLSALLAKVKGSVPEDTDVLENAGMSPYRDYTMYDATCSSDSDVEDAGDCGDDNIDDEDYQPMRRKKKSKKKKKCKIEDKEDEGSGSMFVGESTVGVTGDGRSISDL